ncbi:MAG: F0F1 ATP synthase subunit epsilon [Kineosporiaceae bacterium]
MPLTVEVVAADRVVWTGEAARLLARTVDGEIGILPGHTPLLAILAEGEVRVTPTAGDRDVVARLRGGFVSVDSDRVTVVSDTAAVSDATN